LPTEPWWQEVLAHLPAYTTAKNVEICRAAIVDGQHCYNDTIKCPCNHTTVAVMAAAGYHPDGSTISPRTLLSAYYSLWPVFPAEHIDASVVITETPGSSAQSDAATMRSTARALAAINPNSIGVLDLAGVVRVMAATAQEIEPAEPGAMPTPVLKALSDWVTWTTSAHRPGPWAKDAERGNLFPFLTPSYVGGLEECGITMVINDLLLTTSGWGSKDIKRRSTYGAIRLFPVWRHAAGAGPASFTGLRTKGAFVVSASWSNATDEVSNLTTTSDAGQPCSLFSPWARANHTQPMSVLVTRASDRVLVPVKWYVDDSGSSMLTFATDAGATYGIRPRL
jgi:hypothetical protein